MYAHVITYIWDYMLKILSSINNDIVKMLLGYGYKVQRLTACLSDESLSNALKTQIG